MAKKYDGEPRWDGIDPAVRAACEQWWAELDAMEADPKVQANVAEAVAAARVAVPPWEQPGWVPPVPAREYPDGELLARMRKRLELTRGPSVRLVKFKVTPNRGKLASMTKLKAARKKVKELGAVVRDEAFDDWLGKCVVIAQTPNEWTAAKVLYDSYLKHASSYGNNRGDKALAKEESATITSWGKMMGAEYPNKKRRARCIVYPVRLKRGA